MGQTMGYRDDLQAARDHAAALERELEQAARERDALATRHAEQRGRRQRQILLAALKPWVVSLPLLVGAGWLFWSALEDNELYDDARQVVENMPQVRGWLRIKGPVTDRTLSPRGCALRGDAITVTEGPWYQQSALRLIVRRDRAKLATETLSVPLTLDSRSCATFEHRRREPAEPRDYRNRYVGLKLRCELGDQTISADLELLNCDGKRPDPRWHRRYFTFAEAR